MARAMYGNWAGQVVVQLSIFQAIVWLTSLMVVLEVRKAFVSDAHDDFNRHEEGSYIDDDTVVGGSGTNEDMQSLEEGVSDATNQDLRGEEVVTVAGVNGARLPLFKSVARKLACNPNLHASVIGISWACISNRSHLTLPPALEGSVQIMSRLGLGLAMFSMGLFMGQQERIMQCGPRLALLGLCLKFIIGPAAMAIGSAAVGIRDDALRAAIPQSISSFIFAKEYGLHADVLSTAVVLGMIMSLPFMKTGGARVPVRLICWHGTVWRGVTKGHARERDLMIGWVDIGKILSAITPFYFALALGYCSSRRWWQIFTAEDSKAINRMVVWFAFPFFTFEFTLHLDPYNVRYSLLAADSIAKLIIIAAISIGVMLKFWEEGLCAAVADWCISGFTLASLTNSLVVGAIVWLTSLVVVLEVRKAFVSNAHDESNSHEEGSFIDDDTVVSSSGTSKDMQSLEEGVSDATNQDVRGEEGVSDATNQDLRGEEAVSVAVVNGARVPLFKSVARLFMGQQERIMECGPRLALLGLFLKFIIGPTAMAIGSAAVGIRGDVLRVAIIQVHTINYY
uniref:Auxin efflux carrier component n=1 Tax=Oryza barthii TaxID=65489 RepID=A0A0D3FUP7_9ORYZ